MKRSHIYNIYVHTYKYVNTPNMVLPYAQLHMYVCTPCNAPSTYMYARTYNVPAGFYLITYVRMYTKLWDDRLSTLPDSDIVF